MEDNKLDYWIMYLDGDISLQVLQELLVGYV